ncbi:MAG: hypothetical protein QNI99_17565 [Woeseiaceae bacterium]|nr:hypothetical protein [Woeseiaceae bacterium]
MNMHKWMMVGLLFALPVSAEELVATLDLTQAAASESVRFADGVLRVDATPGERQQTLLHLSDPGVSMAVYAVKGMIRYDVEADGYLQLDSNFGDRGTFFTKGLHTQGPLAAISGSSGWRPFALPFFADGGDQSDGVAPTPEALTLSVHLPGSGYVELRDVTLYQYADGENPIDLGSSFVGIGMTTLIGAIGGTLVGLWGALVGFLVPRGRARGFVINSATVLVIAGILVFFGGLYALGTGQPYDVYYPLLLLGAILVFVVGWLRAGLPRRYEAVELQKMQAMDV